MRNTRAMSPVNKHVPNTPSLQNTCQESAVHLLKVNFPNSVAISIQKQLLLWIIKDLSKPSVHTWRSTCSTLPLPKKLTACPPRPPPPNIPLWNIPAICVYPLWILSHCYCFRYTFSITTCCLPPTQLRKKERSLCWAMKGPIYCIWKLSHWRQALKGVYKPCTCLTSNDDTLTQLLNYWSHCHLDPDGFLPNHIPRSTQVTKWGRKGSLPGYTPRKCNVKSIKTFFSPLHLPFDLSLVQNKTNWKN